MFDVAAWSNQGLAVFLAVLAAAGMGWLVRWFVVRDDKRYDDLVQQVRKLEARLNEQQEARLRDEVERGDQMAAALRSVARALTAHSSVIRSCHDRLPGNPPAMPDLPSESDMFTAEDKCTTTKRGYRG